MIKRIILFVLLGLFIFKPSLQAAITDTELYAQKIINIEAKEKAVLAQMWRSIYPFYQKLLGMTSEDACSYVCNEHKKIQNSTIPKLREPRNEASYILAPRNCVDIHAKFLSAKDLYIELLRYEASYMCICMKEDVERRYLENMIRLRTDSFKNYKEAWDKLARQLPQDFKLPPFEILNYDYNIHIAKHRGELAALSAPCEEKPRVVYRYLAGVSAPASCQSIHADFLKSWQLKIAATSPNLSCEQKAVLCNQSKLLWAQAELKLAELISSYYQNLLKTFPIKPLPTPAPTIPKIATETETMKAKMGEPLTEGKPSEGQKIMEIFYSRRCKQVNNPSGNAHKPLELNWSVGERVKETNFEGCKWIPGVKVVLKPLETPTYELPEARLNSQDPSFIKNDDGSIELTTSKEDGSIKFSYLSDIPGNKRIAIDAKKDGYMDIKGLYADLTILEPIEKFALICQTEPSDLKIEKYIPSEKRVADKFIAQLKLVNKTEAFWYITIYFTGCFNGDFIKQKWDGKFFPANDGTIVLDNITLNTEADPEALKGGWIKRGALRVCLDRTHPKATLASLFNIFSRAILGDRLEPAKYATRINECINDIGCINTMSEVLGLNTLDQFYWKKETAPKEESEEEPEKVIKEEIIKPIMEGRLWEVIWGDIWGRIFPPKESAPTGKEEPQETVEKKDTKELTELITKNLENKNTQGKIEKIFYTIYNITGDEIGGAIKSFFDQPDWKDKLNAEILEGYPESGSVSLNVKKAGEY
jgi:hypothetical protein